MTIFPWKNGKCLVWDFTCSDTLAPSHISTSSNQAAKVGENAENLKLTKYAQLEDAYIVVPICVETLGSWGPNGIKFIAELENKIKAETKEDVDISVADN